MQPFNGDIHLQDQFIKLKSQFGITHVIETGTYHGHTTKWLAMNFENVDTIESNMNYFKIAEGLLRDPSIQGELYNYGMWSGSSAERLGEMIEQTNVLDSKLLIFLDAHWYKNPVLDELRQIAEVDAKPVIVIHDFKNPNDLTMGYDEYPEQKIVYEWSWIKPYVDKIYGEGNYNYYYNDKAVGSRRGCVFITPK